MEKRPEVSQMYTRMTIIMSTVFFFSSRRRHTRSLRDWSSDVCSPDLLGTSLGEMYDSKEQCRQDTALMHIHPSEHPPHVFFAIDPEDADWYRGNDRLHEKLGALGVEIGRASCRERL